MKKCSRCGIEKPLTSEYYQINRQSNTGFRPDCKECRTQLYRNKNKEVRDGSQYRAVNGLKLCRMCKEIKPINCFTRNYRRKDSLNNDCRPCLAEKVKIRRESDKEKFDRPAKEYKKRNAEKVRARATAYTRKRRLQDGEFRFKGAVSRLVTCYLKRRESKKKASFFVAIGYSRSELVKHIEKQFTKGMSWDNYGEWHIDHITPNSEFTYESMEDDDFKLCWALSNLRPMWAKDNKEKSNKITNLL